MSSQPQRFFPSTWNCSGSSRNAERVDKAAAATFALAAEAGGPGGPPIMAQVLHGNGGGDAGPRPSIDAI